MVEDTAGTEEVGMVLTMDPVVTEEAIEVIEEIVEIEGTGTEEIETEIGETEIEIGEAREVATVVTTKDISGAADGMNTELDHVGVRGHLVNGSGIATDD
jgi:hypothetical protein